MKTRWIRLFMFGTALTAALTKPAQSAEPGVPIISSTIMIHVHDYAKVDRDALAEAKKEAAGIFKKAGIQSRWIDPGSAERSFPSSHIQLNILPRTMYDRFGDRLPDNVVGIAPGNGPDRQWAYVFYNRVRTLTMRHAAFTHENTGKILGHVIAHEIGHLLLNVHSHSTTGIMRGGWDRLDLLNASYGYLHFTPEQAEVLREEVGRRSGGTLERAMQRPN